MLYNLRQNVLVKYQKADSAVYVERARIAKAVLKKRSKVGRLMSLTFMITIKLKSLGQLSL